MAFLSSIELDQLTAGQSQPRLNRNQSTLIQTRDEKLSQTEFAILNQLINILVNFQNNLKPHCKYQWS